MLAAKLRRAMVNPKRSPLSGMIGIGGASLPQRDKGAPSGPGRLRLVTVPSCSAKGLGNFAVRNAAATAIVKTDGWRGCSAAPRDLSR